LAFASTARVGDSSISRMRRESDTVVSLLVVGVGCAARQLLPAHRC
jgi:hypothetical protein